MPVKVVTKNLEEVDCAIRNGTQGYFHAYGILKLEERVGSTLIWHLFDEYKTVSFYLIDKPEHFPRPRRGDVVRIHRARIGILNRRAEVVHGRDVVYWPAFEYDPIPVATAKKPTITEDDNTRRRVLESLYCSTITRISDMTRASGSFFDIAGCVKSTLVDQYGHFDIIYRDGTEPTEVPGQPKPIFVLKVFQSLKPEESESHFNTAKSMKEGQYFVATNVKRHRERGHVFHLSANDQYGRSLRLVDKASILGTKLTQSVNGDDPVLQEDMSTHQPTTSYSNKSGPLRRSPRLRQGCDNNNIPSIPIVEQVRDMEQFVGRPKTAQAIHISKRDPPFHLICEIAPKTEGYSFYNLIAAVRTRPKLTRQYGNCVFQLFDGSMHKFISYFDEEFEKGILDECLVLYVYSKQAEHDIDDHFRKAMEDLEVGDLIYLTNVKVSFTNSGRIKLEVQANNNHGKSIKKIEPFSEFGELIQNTVNTRLDYLSQESSDLDVEPEEIPEPLSEPEATQ